MKARQNNYLRMLQDAIGLLSAVNSYMSQDRGQNRANICEIGNAINALQKVARAERTRAIRDKVGGYYNKRAQEALDRQARIKQQTEESDDETS